MQVEPNEGCLRSAGDVKGHHDTSTYFSDLTSSSVAVLLTLFRRELPEYRRNRWVLNKTFTLALLKLFFFFFKLADLVKSCPAGPGPPKCRYSRPHASRSYRERRGECTWDILHERERTPSTTAPHLDAPAPSSPQLQLVDPSLRPPPWHRTLPATAAEDENSSWLSKKVRLISCVRVNTAINAALQ